MSYFLLTCDRFIPTLEGADLWDFIEWVLPKADLDKRMQDVGFDMNEINFCDEWRHAINYGNLECNC